MVLFRRARRLLRAAAALGVAALLLHLLLAWTATAAWPRVTVEWGGRARGSSSSSSSDATAAAPPAHVALAPDSLPANAPGRAKKDSRSSATAGGMSLADLHRWCEREARADGGEDATVPLLAHAWSALRIHAAAASATRLCASSRWPLRHALRPFLASTLLAPASAQAAGGYLVADLPAAWSDALIAHVSRADACTALATAATWAAEFAASGRPVAVPHAHAADAARALCTDIEAPAGSTGPRGRLRLDGLHAPRPLAAVAFERRCRNTGASALWDALADALLPDGVNLPAPASGAIPCGARLSPNDLLEALTSNAAAIHRAPPTTTLHTPRDLADAVRHPVPGDTVLPLLLPNAAEVAAAAAANDPAALILALTPPVLQRALPAVITSFNVMVSPLGTLTAIRPRTSPPPAAAERSKRPASCPPGLDDLYEPEPAPLPAPDMTTTAFEEAAVGGPAALAQLRQLAPFAMLLPYWPAGGGANLTETAAAGEDGDGSAMLDVFNVATPERNDAPVPPAPCDAWDRSAAGGPPAVLLVSEVVVLPHISDAYYWVTVDLIGRLQLLAPYLEANPHVRVHVSYAAMQVWADEPNHFVWQWLDALGMSGRLISGRVVARIAHILDKAPVGPRVHPLQLLALRDAGDRVLGAAGLPSLGQLHQAAAAALPPPRPADNSTTTSSLLPSPKPSILLLQRHRDEPRFVPNLDMLRQFLEARGLSPTVWNPPPASPGSLAAAVAAWAGADAVVAPHGSGLANAVFMRAGATVVESIPRGHAGAALYYLQLAHVMRQRHHHIVMPGTLSTPVAHDVVLVEALLCGDLVHHTVAGPMAAAGASAAATAPFVSGRCGPASASNLALRDQSLVPAPHPRGQLLECLPAPRPPRRRLSVDEPVLALAPLEGFVAPVPACAHCREGVGAPAAKTYRPWASLPDVLPLAAARAVALLLPADDGCGTDETLFAFDPTQRGLVRALEAARILPLAMPPVLCSNCSSACGSRENDDEAGDEPCAGPHGSMLLALVGAVVQAVAELRGVPAADVPLVTTGLAAGAHFSGVLAANARVAAVHAQLQPPAGWMLRTYTTSRSGTAGDAHAARQRRPCRVRDRRPVTVQRRFGGANATLVVDVPMADLADVLPAPDVAAPPALWLTGARTPSGEAGAMAAFGRRWQQAVEGLVADSSAASGPGPTSDAYVFNSRTARGVSAAELHRAAPWLLSYAASAVVVNAALASGLLEEPSEEQLAAYASSRPWCARDGTFSDEPPGPRADGEPALYMPSPSRSPDVALDAVLQLFETAVVFRVLGPARGEPVFLAAHELAALPGGVTRHFARFVPASDGSGSNSDGSADSGSGSGWGAGCAHLGTTSLHMADRDRLCRAARTTFTRVSAWLRRTITAANSTLDCHSPAYHEEPWADIAAWFSHAVDRAQRQL